MADLFLFLGQGVIESLYFMFLSLCSYLLLSQQLLLLCGHHVPQLQLRERKRERERGKRERSLDGSMDKHNTCIYPPTCVVIWMIVRYSCHVSCNLTSDCITTSECICMINEGIFVVWENEWERESQSPSKGGKTSCYEKLSSFVWPWYCGSLLYS